MPRSTRKHKSKRAKTSRRRQSGGSNTLENVLGVASAVGYNREALIPGLELSKRSASNTLTQMALNRAVLKSTLYDVWKGAPSVIVERLRSPLFKNVSIQEARTLLRNFRRELDGLQSEINRLRYELQHGGRNAPHIIRSDLQDFREMHRELQESLRYFEQFLEREQPGLRQTLNV